jgi:hypothetical protein
MPTQQNTTAARVFLAVGALIMLGTGALFLLRPETLTDGMGVELPTAAGRTDVRATYGGILGGIGIYLAWAAASPSRAYGGLVAAGAVSVSAALARVVGFVAEGGVDVRNMMFGAMELALGVFALVLAWRSRPAR